MHQKTDTCIIVGAGSGLSASLARLFRTNDMDVVLAARNVEKLRGLRKKLVVIWFNVTRLMLTK